MNDLYSAALVVALIGLASWLLTRSPLRSVRIRLVESTDIINWDSLSSREMEVAQLVADGWRNQEIAEHLHITINTVETHVRNIYSKLDVHSRPELVKALREELD